MRTRTVVGALALAAFSARLAHAQAQEDEESKLLAILAEETAVATKTRLNSDFVPGIVTVLHGEELEALGIETAWEALSLVPGIQSFRDGTGLPSVIVRGVPFPFNSGNVKVLVNGVSLSRESAGINGIALQIPIQQVDRIEVIRGPGSVVYGDFAFMGLVNVVTRQNETQLFARFGGYDTLTAGADAAWKGGDGWTGSVTAAGARSNDAPVPEPRTAKERRASGAATLQGHGFSLTAEGVARHVDDTSTAPGGSVTSKQSHLAIEGRYARVLAPALRAEARASYLDDDFTTAPSTVSGAVGAFGLDLTFEGLHRHSVLFSTSYELGTIDNARFSLAPPPPPAPAPPPLVIRDKRREILGITLQDRFDISEKLAVTAGARFDRYTDVDHRVTPRVALVYRVSERHLLKLQYAEGFRAPTLFELYGTGSRNPDIGFEINRTAELDYVFRRPRQVARATFFLSKLDDIIFIADPMKGRFGNVRSGKAYGAELEWEQELFTTLKAQANVSWVDAKDDRSIPPVNDTPTPEAKWLWNLALLYRPMPRLLVGARWNHVGNRAAAGTKDAYNLVDLTVTKGDLLARGISLSAGVKDVFGSAPTYAFEGPFSTVFFRYPGRTFFVQLAWSR
jgi:outer membrane receptor for ferrienterochelin and colicins